jgi:hypothetical protein
MHCLMLYYHALLVSRKYHCSCKSLVLAAGMQIVLPCMCVQCVSIKVPLQVGMTSGVRVCARAALQRWNELVGRGGRRSRYSTYSEHAGHTDFPLPSHASPAANPRPFIGGEGSQRAGIGKPPP